MSEAYIAIGCNLGEKRRQMVQAIDLMQSLGVLRAVAPLYRTGAYGYTDQPDFLNSVVCLKTGLPPLELLEALKRLEHRLGRKKRERWGPREMDLDIIFYNGQLVNEEGLTIPHPDLSNRRFVLQPLADIAPDFISPRHHRTVATLLAECPDKTNIQLIDRNWYPDET